ncbi:hypothetical protein DPMN_089447 [Dreissena polymorpha]|uniref:Uncharacterized protein n=1 Tax=Dreissena polymorpha TaxID=45954 RepID=A0A9D4KVZ1_DREPO|nr:hypothetical protein DPMN_089447 [Dreissena polymorpha]
MDRFSDSEFRNWIKACLAIKCVKDGMLPLIEYFCNKHSTDNIRNITQTCNLVAYTCSQCDVKTLKPFHTPVECTYKRCDCRGNSRKVCPENEACGVMYDQIKASHVSNNPNWSNTDSKLWSTSPWEQMKCYIVTPGYEETDNICDADITALLQICLNNSQINVLFFNNSGCLHEVRRIRNDLFHSGTMKVASDVMQGIFCHATILLKEVQIKFPDCRPEIEHELNVLQMIEQEDFLLTPQHKFDVIHDFYIGMKQTLVELKEQDFYLELIVQNLSTEINLNKSETDILMKEKEDHIEALEQRMHACQRNLQSMEQNQRQQAQKVSTFGKDNNVIVDEIRLLKERVERLERKTDQTPTNELLLPTDEILNGKCESKITIHAKNVEDVAAYEDITERMCDVANCIINKKPLQPRNSSLKSYFSGLFQRIWRGLSRITHYNRKCLELYIESPSIQSWLTLCEDFSNGTIAMGFQPIQRYLRSFEGLENLTLIIEFDEEYFARCAKESIDQLNARLNYLLESETDLPDGDNRISVICDGQRIGSEILKVRVFVVCAPDSKNIVDRLNKDLIGKFETKIVSFTDVHLHVDSEQNDFILIILTRTGCKEIQKIKKEVLEKLFHHESNVKILFSCQIDTVDNYCGMNCDRYSSVARYSTTEYKRFCDDVIACVEQFNGTFVPLQAKRFIIKPDIIYVPEEVMIVMFEEENAQKSFQKVVVRHADKELPATRVHTNVWAFKTGDLPNGDNRISVLCDGQDIGSEILKVCELDLKKAINAISVAMDTRPLTSLATLLQTTAKDVDEEFAKLLSSKPSSIVETLLHLRSNYGGGGKSLFEICKSVKLKESVGRINQEKELPKQPSDSESLSDDDHELRSPLFRNSSASLYRGIRDSDVGHRQFTESVFQSGSGIVNRPGSIKLSTQMPRVGSKKTNVYDELWNDDLLEKLENLSVDQSSIEAAVARKGSKREGMCLPSTRI